MVTNTIQIGTALLPLRRMTRAARTAVSPCTPRAPIPVAFGAAVAGVPLRSPIPPRPARPAATARRWARRLTGKRWAFAMVALFALSPVAVADTTPPTLSFATVLSTGSSFQFGFSENVDLFNVPPASAFTATADGSPVTISNVAQAGSAKLSARVSPFIRQGQTVVVTYTDPTAGDDANAIQDTAGNDAASFTTGVSGVPAVTNISTLATTVPAN